MTDETKVQLENSNPVMIAEYRLLNALYLKPDYFLDSNVTPELFANKTTRSIFESMQYLLHEGVPFSKNAIFQRASGLNVNTKAEQVDIAIDISNEAPESIKDIIGQLRQTRNGLDAIKTLKEAEALINKNPIRTPDIDNQVRNLITKAETTFINMGSINRIETYKDVQKEYKDIYAERKNGKKYRFGDPILDKHITYGPAPGCGGLIGGATGMGKSAFVLNLLERIENQGIPAMYYSMEMGLADTMDRKVALKKGIPLSDIVNPPDYDTWLSISEEIDDVFDNLVKNEKFRFTESANVSLAQVTQDIKKFQADIGQQYCIVVFDLLSMIKDFTMDSQGKNFAQQIEVAINQLNALAKELGIHYIAVLQMNRSIEAERIDDLEDIAKFRPTRTSIKNANAFLERVRYALGLFRPRYYAEEYIEDKELWEDMPDVCTVYSLKQNQGKVGAIGKYLFEPEIMKVTPIEEDEQENSEEE